MVQTTIDISKLEKLEKKGNFMKFNSIDELRNSIENV
jgi:hypothetical protein